MNTRKINNSMIIQATATATLIMMNPSKNTNSNMIMIATATVILIKAKIHLNNIQRIKRNIKWSHQRAVSQVKVTFITKKIRLTKLKHKPLKNMLKKSWLTKVTLTQVAISIISRKRTSLVTRDKVISAVSRVVVTMLDWIRVSYTRDTMTSSYTMSFQFKIINKMIEMSRTMESGHTTSTRIQWLRKWKIKIRVVSVVSIWEIL